MATMGDDLEKKLAEAAEARRELDVQKWRRSNLADRMDGARAEIDRLRARLVQEEQDVERLERLSLTSVLAALKGSRDDDLAYERAEAHAAAYKMAEAQDRLAAMQADYDAASVRVNTLSGAEAVYKGLIQEKERWLAASGSPQGQRLLELAEEIGSFDGELRELGEAHRAVQAAEKALAQVRSSLGSASSWSTYDTFFGGGLIGSAVKHSRLDDAAEAARWADRCLAVLRTELADVKAGGTRLPDLAVGEMTRFADVWFDNIFTDLHVRSHIKQSQADVERCAGVVNRVRRGLAERTKAAQERRAALERERREIIGG
jgi:hypothetical protein